MIAGELDNFQVASMRNYTTLRIGGPAKLYQPCSQEALIALLGELHLRHQAFHVLGNGSNLLVNDDGLERPVIHTGKLQRIQIQSPYVQVDAGCLLPVLLRAACRQNLGGIEYLASVPGTVGGGICMNAGRGPQHGRFIHQVVDSVTCHDGTRVWTFDRSELGTDFRRSRFQDNPELCIVSARLKLEPRDAFLVRRQIHERLAFAKGREDHSGPNAGSVFRTTKDLASVQGLQKGKARFSRKTPNWIVNQGGNFQEVLELIRSVGTDSELEWDVWHS